MWSDFFKAFFSKVETKKNQEGFAVNWLSKKYIFSPEKYDCLKIKWITIPLLKWLTVSK